ncbi:MAG: glycosyltransferase family 39 protein [Candidatus Omnitrophica bacterium]|nr:glycosyltransferase family 39 protein [Candidatus Omnitrophota bacterium]
MIKKIWLSVAVIVASAFLFMAPAWYPFVREANGRNLFISPDAMVLLGAVLLLAYLSAYFLPSRFFVLIVRAGQGICRRWRLTLFLMSVILLASLIWVNRHILHSFMNSADEHSCYFLAECFRMGKWWVEPHPLSEFFDVIHVGNRDGKWFSVYPFGWPLLMALGIQWNILDWMNPLMTTLAFVIFFIVARRLYGRPTALLASFLLLASPFFLFTGASYFSHGTCLLMVALFSYSFLKWRESEHKRSEMVWAALAALAIGYGLATRYLSMAAIAAPFLLYQLWPVLRRKEPIRKVHVVVLSILAFFVLLVLFQNFVVTGKFHKAPNRYDKSWERLGFRDFYTPLDGIIFVFARFFYLMDWMPAFLVMLFLVRVFQKRQMPAPTKLFHFAFFYPVIAYFFYFSWGGNQYGPRYYYDGFPFFAMVLADGIVQWVRSDNEKLRKFILTGFMLSLIVSGYLYAKQGEYYEEASRQRKALYDFAEERIQNPAIVFIRGFLGQRLVMSQDDAIRNRPALDGKILYAKDKAEENQRLRDYYPEREHYLGYFDRDEKKAKLVRL